jgi:hypothetical protein
MRSGIRDVAQCVAPQVRERIESSQHGLDICLSATRNVGASPPHARVSAVSPRRMPQTYIVSNFLTGRAETHLPADSLIYQGSVFVSADVDTLEITISATGDLPDGGTPFTNSLWLNCQLDGNDCNAVSLDTSAQIPEATATPAVGTDNNIHYSWCMPIKPKKGPHSLQHDVQLSMASGDGVRAVHIEQIQVLVGGTNFGGPNKLNACSPAPVPTPVP